MQRHQKIFKMNLLIIGLGVILIYILSYINKNYVNQNNKFLKIPNNLEIINLGSSHSLYGIKYPEKINGFNLAIASQPLYYDLKILEKYSSKLDENAIVIIPISIFTFYQGNRVEKLNDNYYTFLKANQIYLGDKKKEFLQRNFSLFYNGKDIISVVKFLKKSLKNKKFEPESLKYPKNLSFEEKVVEAEITSKRHLGLTDSDFLQLPEISLKYLKQILELCKKKNLKAVLITTPQSYLYNEKITKVNYEKRIYTHINKLREKFQFEYLDYSHDERFQNNLNLFFDDDHLNEKGAEIFTEILLKDLNYES